VIVPGWTVSLPSEQAIPLFEVHYSDRRTLALKVDSQARLIVHAPRRTSRSVIEVTLQKKANWVRRKTAQAQARVGLLQIPIFLPGQTFPFQGSQCPLEWASSGAPALRLYEGRFWLEPGFADRAMRLFLRWYWEQARALFATQVQVFAKVMGIDPGIVSLSRARGRWGSCSRRGIRLNWRLVMAPQPVLDYVIVHELTHRKVSDHSARFWREVERILPDWQARRSWLKEKGASLFFLEAPFVPNREEEGG
jgi:predicted metal-dependent hydrolase